MFKRVWNWLLKVIKVESHGKHVFADFVWNVEIDKIDDVLLANTVFRIMKNSVKNTKMTVVHEKMCILGQTEESPPGFCSVLLIDESHISAHCYSDRGWLALDAFTCGGTDPVPIMEYIIFSLKLVFPSLKCTYYKTHKRFHY